MGRAKKLVCCSIAITLAVALLALRTTLGERTANDGGGGDWSHRLRRPWFHYESGYLYIADAYMGPMRVGPGGYLYMRRQCSPWALTVCPLASQMELSLIRG
jgi:hypothetical protein